MWPFDAAQVPNSPELDAYGGVQAQLLQDYFSRWVPVQDYFIQRNNFLGPDGAERAGLLGREAANVGLQLGNAEQALNAGRSRFGAGSGADVMRQAGLLDEGAAGRGLGLTQANQDIQQAYLAGLNDIINMGDTQLGRAMGGLSFGAQMGQEDAIADTGRHNAERAGLQQTLMHEIDPMADAMKNLPLLGANSGRQASMGGSGEQAPFPGSGGLGADYTADSPVLGNVSPGDGGQWVDIGLGSMT